MIRAIQVLVLIAAIFVVNGCAAKRQVVGWDTTDKAMLTALIVCQGADLGTTAYALSNGARELNPLLPSGIAGIAVVKVAITGLIAGVSHVADSHKLRRQILGVGAFFGCAPAAWNLVQLSK